MGRKEKKVKDPNRPKRPTSAYFYFIAAKREEAKKRGDDISRVAEWTKAVSQDWRKVSDSEKKPFDDLAKKDRKRYDDEMAAYGGKRPKDSNKPKRPQSAYFLFLADFREKEKAKFKYDGGHKDLIRAAGEAWNKLSTAEKAPFEKKNMAEREKYEQAMADYAAGGSSAKKAKTDSGAQEVDDDDDDEDDEEDEESD